MLELIDASVRTRREELAASFQSAQPVRHLMIDEFLDPRFCRELARDFLSARVLELQDSEYKRWPALMAEATAAVPPYLKQPVFLLDWAHP